MGELKPPIFLLGNVRSGTTMMQEFFALHPEVTTWFEARPVWNYAAPARKHDRFVAADATPRVIRHIRMRFLKYQQAHGGLRVMEKTPQNILRIPYVHKIFPESKFVYIIRHPFAQISSSEIKSQRVIDWKDRKWAWYRIQQTPPTQLYFYAGRFLTEWINKKILRKKHPRVYGVRYPEIYEERQTLSTEQVISRQWAICSRQAEEDLKEIDPAIFVRIRYEDFVMDPVPHFEEVLNFFGLAMKREIAEQVSKRADPNRQMKWTRISPEVLRSCLPILEDEMKRHGYEVPEELRETL